MSIVKRRNRGFGGFTGFTSLIPNKQSNGGSKSKPTSPTREKEAPEMHKTLSAEQGRPQPTALQESTARSRDEQSGKVMLEIVDGSNLPLTARSKPYILASFDSNFTNTSSPTSYAPGSSYADFSNPIWQHSVEFDVSLADAESEGRFDFTLYDSIPQPRNSSSSSAASRKTTDFLIGTTQLRLTPEQLKESKNTIHHLSLKDSSDRDLPGTLQVSISFKRNQSFLRLTPDDFQVMKKLGSGSFGVVYKVRKRDSGRLYAMKVLSKAAIAKEKHAAHVISEKNILQLTRLNESPFLVGLKFSFQTETHLYFVMDLKNGGELFAHLQKDGGRWEEDRVVFYAAEILIAIETLHSQDIIYRDLKPENVLLDAAGHVSLCDFGLSKELRKGKKTQTFCGTSDYLSPEVIKGDIGYDGLIDYWALGILIYEMFTGYTPFFSEDHLDKYKLIMSATLKFPRRGVSEEAKDLLTKLLKPQPSARLGAGGVHEIQEHPFFRNIDWKAMAARRVTPPFKPSMSSSSPERSPVALELDLPSTPALTDETSFCSSPQEDSKAFRNRRSSCEEYEYEEPEKEKDWYRDFTFSATESGRNSFSSHHRKSSSASRHASDGAFHVFSMTPVSDSDKVISHGNEYLSSTSTHSQLAH